MKPYWIKTHPIIKKTFSNFVWDIPNNDKKVYLTFDDGPAPEITDWVLNQLKLYNAKASFFCIGKNIENHPEIVKRIIDEGHIIGNHSFNHLNGWRTSTNKYVENSEHCHLQAAICHLPPEHCKLFRPPYGKIKSSQSKKLRQLGYKIIMWDVLSADFDQKISPEKCLNNVIANVESGSIIVFHDSKKAFQNLEFALPRTLQFLKENGFVCEAIEYNHTNMVL